MNSVDEQANRLTETLGKAFLSHRITLDDCRRIVAEVLKTTRQEALRELRKRLEKREQFYTEQEAQSEGHLRLTRGLQRNEASGCIAELDRLASEGG